MFEKKYNQFINNIKIVLDVDNLKDLSETEWKDICYDLVIKKEDKEIFKQFLIDYFDKVKLEYFIGENNVVPNIELEEEKIKILYYQVGLELNKLNFKSLPYKYRNTPEIIKIALKNTIENIKYVDSDISEYREVCLLAVKQDGKIISKFNNEMLLDYEIILEAVKNNGHEMFLSLLDKIPPYIKYDENILDICFSQKITFSTFTNKDAFFNILKEQEDIFKNNFKLALKFAKNIGVNSLILIPEKLYTFELIYEAFKKGDFTYPLLKEEKKQKFSETIDNKKKLKTLFQQIADKLIFEENIDTNIFGMPNYMPNNTLFLGISGDDKEKSNQIIHFLIEKKPIFEKILNNKEIKQEIIKSHIYSSLLNLFLNNNLNNNEFIIINNKKITINKFIFNNTKGLTIKLNIDGEELKFKIKSDEIKNTSLINAVVTNITNKLFNYLNNIEENDINKNSLNLNI